MVYTPYLTVSMGIPTLDYFPSNTTRFRFPGDFSVGHVAGRFRQRSIAMDDGRSFRESCAAEIVRNDRRVTMLNQVNQGREFDGANCPLLALTGTCLPKIADITLWFQQRTWHWTYPWPEWSFRMVEFYGFHTWENSSNKQSRLDPRVDSDGSIKHMFISMDWCRVLEFVRLVGADEFKTGPVEMTRVFHSYVDVYQRVSPRTLFFGVWYWIRKHGTIFVIYGKSH